MTRDALRAALGRLGMTPPAFAAHLGVHRVTVLHWLSGAYPVPRTVELIVELMGQAEELRDIKLLLLEERAERE